MATPRQRNTSELIALLQTDADAYLLSPGEVDMRLSEIAAAHGFRSLGASVSIQEVTHEWGTCVGHPALRDSISPESNVVIRLYLDSEEGAASEAFVQRILHQLLDAMKSVWSRGFRNEHGGLYLKDSGANDVFASSIRRLATRHDVLALAVVYSDIDKFKLFNDRCSHEEGNRALRHVYATMHQVVRDLNGLAFFDGGDEFILVLPTSSRVDIATALWALRSRLQALEFGKDQSRISMTSGVVVRPVNVICDSLRDVKTACEDLTKGPGTEKEKKRGTISFEQIVSPINDVCHISHEQLFKLGIAVSRSRQFISAPFGDERLNLVAHQAAAAFESLSTPGAVTKAVDEVLQWLGVELSDECDERPLLVEGFFRADLSRGAVAIAVVHGLARAAARMSSSATAPSLAVQWSPTGKEVAVGVAGKVVWGASSGEMTSLAFGPMVSEGIPEKAGGAVVGVQIGFASGPLSPGGNALPSSLFLTHVRVDDRPRTGGGLPDFWQVAVAQVMTALGSAEPGCKVLIWGVSPETTETYQRLSGGKQWSLDEVSLLSGLPTQRITSIAAALPTQIQVVQSSDELLDQIYQAYLAYAGQSSVASSMALENQSVLRRAMTEVTPMAQSEGVVCDTAALAYPIAIDTLRKASGVRLSRDDSDQEHRELVAFKLKLLTPQVDPIPKYLLQQQAELDTYAHDVLLKKDGLIRAKLESAHQVSAFVAHLASYFGATTSGRSTRRACLVVPHVPESALEPKPFGLISVWATPRARADGVRLLDFVCVWRTVEAFIGLPYSLYGSIRLAQQLVAAVVSQTGLGNSSAQPQMGELTYVAMSLHLGSDDFHTRVAKRIVDLAAD